MRATVGAALDAAKVPESERGTQTVVGSRKLEAHCGAFQNVKVDDPKTAPRTVQAMVTYLKGKGWRDNVQSVPTNVRLIRDEMRFSIHTDRFPSGPGKASSTGRVYLDLYLQSDTKECGGPPPR